MCPRLFAGALVVCLGLVPTALWAQTSPPPAGGPQVAAATRNDAPRRTVRAVRVENLKLDGLLDEPFYQQTPSVGDFIQQEPREGAPSTERTEVWVFFDDENVYVSGRLWDTNPGAIVANEMRRDNRNIFNNDNFGVAFDTYNNRRTGFFFQTNPLGGLRDALVSDEGQPNYEWDGVWDVKTRRFEQGWTAEFAFPFKSLRYEGSGEQVWGINLRRLVLSKNETSYLTRIPASYGGRGITMFSLAASLVGIQPPSASRNLELKPYGIGKVVTNNLSTPTVSNDPEGEFGFDAKYGLTRSLIADFTYNTDFAQVEDDEQQVNLTRFSLLFPEKREFFLEGQGIFEFGGGSNTAPILFFSRRIGLERGLTVPIQAGGRLTGRAGPYAIGIINIQTDDSTLARSEATNFSVVRVRRDILRRSNVGFLMTRRGPTVTGTGSNEAYGVDANFAFFQDLEISSYYSRTHTPGLDGDEESYRGALNYNADRYGVRYEHLKVGDDFNPEVGFLRRDNYRRNFAALRFSPRPKNSKSIRKFRYEATYDYIASGTGRLETRELEGEFGIDLNSSDGFQTSLTRSYEFLPEPFEIADGVVLPVGGYGFGEISGSYQLGPQRKVAGTFDAAYGSFYSGNRTQAGYTGRMEITSQLAVEPRISINWVDLPEGSFTAKLVSARTTYTLSPRMFVGALVQYNSSNEVLTSNIRFRWEYQPGSDLFVVFSEGRDTLAPGFPGLQNRGFVVKFTRLFRF